MLQLRVRERSFTVTPDGRLTRAQAARYLGVATQTLANWKTQGRGPSFLKLGGKVFYKISALDAFVATGARDN